MKKIVLLTIIAILLVSVVAAATPEPTAISNFFKKIDEGIVKIQAGVYNLFNSIKPAQKTTETTTTKVSASQYKPSSSSPSVRQKTSHELSVEAQKRSLEIRRRQENDIKNR